MDSTPIVSLPLSTRSDAGVCSTVTVTVEHRDTTGGRWLVLADGATMRHAHGDPAEFASSAEAMAFALEATGWLHAVAPLVDWFQPAAL